MKRQRFSPLKKGAPFWFNDSRARGQRRASQNYKAVVFSGGWGGGRRPAASFCGNQGFSQNKARSRPVLPQIAPPTPAPGTSCYPKNKVESTRIQLVVQTRLLVARARKQAPKTKRVGRNLPCSSLFVSANRRGGKGIAGLKRRKPASGKEKLPPFLSRRMLFCPSMGHLAVGIFSIRRPH